MNFSVHTEVNQTNMHVHIWHAVDVLYNTVYTAYISYSVTQYIYS